MEESVVNGRDNPKKVGMESHLGSNDSQTKFRP